jgi:ankyrin repeat protein
MFYLRKVFYLFVIIGFSTVNAGSYDDFFQAIKIDDANAVLALLAKGFDPNSVDPGGQYGLTIAVSASSFRVATVLVDNHATNVEVRSPQDESPLMLASLKGNLELCRKLIARDADVNKPGWAPLHYAATGSHIEVMKLLLANAAYIDASSPNGSTPLMMAAMYGNDAAVSLLLEAGADPMLKNSLGLTAIDFAQRAERKDAAELIAAAIRASAPKGSW